MLRSLIPAAQILVAALLVTAILFQPSSAGIGTVGGADGMHAFHTKRGFEKFLFIATIVLAIVFVVLSVLAIAL